MRPSAFLQFLPVLICVIACKDAFAEVIIHHDPPAVEHRNFDPAHPPVQMPHLDPGEAAVTETTFNCAVKSSTKGTSHQEADGNTQSIAKVDAIEMTLSLHVIVWLPNRAPQKLIDHEEGHRRIAEQIYKDRADNAARAAAAKVDGREFRGSGATAEQANGAVDSALQKAQDTLCNAYLEKTGGVAGRVGDLYDQITHHGTRLRPAEDQAIVQAFEQYDKEQKK